jgi:hypothetical protein
MLTQSLLFFHSRRWVLVSVQLLSRVCNQSVPRRAVRSRGFLLPAWEIINFFKQLMKNNTLTLAFAALTIFLVTKAECQYAGTTRGYPKFYNSITASVGVTYPTNKSLWAPVTQLLNASGKNITLTNGGGLMVIDPYGTGGPGGVSESMGYMMILAALYNDQNTFDKLSYTIQAGAASGSNLLGGLFNWYWVQQTAGSSTFTAYNYGSGNNYSAPYPCDSGNSVNSAGDADINIALGYMYATWAQAVYGWSSAPNIGSQPSYNQMAAKYITALRTHDFIQKLDPNAPAGNLYILADGMQQSSQYYQFNSGANWHPDYSDPRAYQLFPIFDTTGAAFWSNAFTATLTSWKSLWSFGVYGYYTDNRTESLGSSTNGGPISPAYYFTRLQGATLQGLKLKSITDYTQTIAYRGGAYPDNYAADCSRIPMRLTEYLSAAENFSSTNYGYYEGIANCINTALITAFDDQQTNPALQHVACPAYDNTYSAMPIFPTPYRSITAGTSDFLTAGIWDILHTGGNYCWPYNLGYNTISALASSNYFGNDGTGLSEFDNGIFAPALTLWGLTIAKNYTNVPTQNTPMVDYVNGLNSSSSQAIIQTAPTATYVTMVPPPAPRNNKTTPALKFASASVNLPTQITLINCYLNGGRVIAKNTKLPITGQWRWANPSEVDFVVKPVFHEAVFFADRASYAPIYTKIKISYKKK